MMKSPKSWPAEGCRKCSSWKLPRWPLTWRNTFKPAPADDTACESITLYIYSLFHQTAGLSFPSNIQNIRTLDDCDYLTEAPAASHCDIVVILLHLFFLLPFKFESSWILEQWPLASQCPCARCQGSYSGQLSSRQSPPLVSGGLDQIDSSPLLSPMRLVFFSWMQLCTRHQKGLTFWIESLIINHTHCDLLERGPMKPGPGGEKSNTVFSTPVVHRGKWEQGERVF